MPDGYYQYEVNGVKHFTDSPPNQNLNAVFVPEKQAQPLTDPIEIGIQRAGGINPYTYNVDEQVSMEFSKKYPRLIQHLFGKDIAVNQMTDDQKRYHDQSVNKYKSQLYQKHMEILKRAEKTVDETVKNYNTSLKDQMASEDKAIGNLMKLKPTIQSVQQAAPGYFASRGIDLSKVISQEKAKGGYKETEYNAALDDLRNMYKIPSGIMGQLMYGSPAAKQRARKAEEIFNSWSKEKNPDGSYRYSPHELIWMADNAVRKIDEKYFNIIADEKISKNPEAMKELNQYFQEEYGYVPQKEPGR